MSSTSSTVETSLSLSLAALATARRRRGFGESAGRGATGAAAGSDPLSIASTFTVLGRCSDTLYLCHTHPNSARVTP